MKPLFIRVVVTYYNVGDFYCLSCSFFFSLEDFIFVPVFSLQKAGETKIQPETLWHFFLS